ncbi:MAG: 3-dehydroquinate synthase [Firmicutes bacterium]|nr:3-dehydroquinate synthase [Bacillota bacterium]
MNQVNINLGRRSYKILIGRGLLERCGEYLSHLFSGRKTLLVTNPKVNHLYGGVIIKSLQEFGFKVTVAEVPDGEEYKSLQQAERLYDTAFSAGLDRHCPVLALGGGVIGDLAGFVASTYMRGVGFVQVPTTLLAQVDSSVGGKVAVNHPRGKNIIGAFYQPSIVLSDTDTLPSLEDREVRSGISEVIKYGIIGDAQFFSWLEENIESLLELTPGAVANAIMQSCLNKSRVVEADETEQGTRAVLNLGHTVGHALEAITEYKIYRHGEAVAVGMVAAARLAEELSILETEQRKKIEAILIRAGLPTKIPQQTNMDSFINMMYKDKKVTSGDLVFILPENIGSVRIYKNPTENSLINILDGMKGR